MNTIKEVKDKFFSEYAPIIKKIYELGKVHFDICSLWVTEYGHINLETLEDDFEFVQMITECGYNYEYGIPCISLDFNLSMEKDNPSFAKKLQNELGIEYYDDNWYRVEFFNAEDMEEFYNDISNFIQQNPSYCIAYTKRYNIGDVESAINTETEIIARGFMTANNAFLKALQIIVNDIIEESKNNTCYNLFARETDNHIKAIDNKNHITHILDVIKI